LQLQELADLLHFEQLGILENPSREEPPRYFPSPNPTPSIKTARANKILGVNCNGTIEPIFLL
jgi:hypothetical protein